MGDEVVVRIALLLTLLPAVSSAATVEGNPGEQLPGNTVSPNPATPFDVIQFTLNADSETHGNACEQQNAFDGILTLDLSDGDVDVTAIEPAPFACNRIYAPVTGVRGEVEALSPGTRWIQDSFGNSVSVYVAYEGDANKDGVFNSSDLVQVFRAAEYEDDIAQNSTWEEGDWTGDREFTTADLIAAFRVSWRAPRAAQVPEPGARFSVTPAIALLICLTRRSQTR